MLENSTSYGERAVALLEEAVLQALEETRSRGFTRSSVLSKRIGLSPSVLPSPNGKGYAHIAIMGVLYRLYLAGRIEPHHQQNQRGHWGGWRITDEEYRRRTGMDSDAPGPEPGPDPDPPSDAAFAQLPPGEWVSLAEYPVPRAVGPSPEVPALVRFPDHRQYSLISWDQLLVWTVEWLNENGLLVADDMPVKLARGPGCLVNSKPEHPDGRPMSRYLRAGGPDRFCVYARASAFHAVYHTRRLLVVCNQNLADVSFLVPRTNSR